MQIGPELVHFGLHGIGAVPIDFNPEVMAYMHIEILQMVIFYNNSFGIEADDVIGIRVQKFCRFLVGL